MVAKAPVNHNLRCVDGVTLFLPPCTTESKVNLALPDVHAGGVQEYPLGTLAWYAGIGKKFRYCRAGEDITEATSARMLANGNFAPSVVCAGYGIAANAHGFNGVVYAQAEIGQDYIDVGLTGLSKNHFEGAHLQVLPGGNPLSQFYIVYSDASEAAYTRVYLDKPLTQQVTTSMYVGINASPYSRLINGDAAKAPARYVSFMGLPLVNVSDGEFLWLQTAGPAWVQPGSWADDRLPGRGENYRDVYAAIDGAITCSWVFGAATDGYQRVGYLIDATYDDYGSVFVMLQLEG